MKYLSYILIILMFPTNSLGQEKEAPFIFDLSITEDFGCVARINYYKNFHFENDTFSITSKDDDYQLKKQYFSKNRFIEFFDTLTQFKPNKFKKHYKWNCFGTATGSGKMTVKYYNINKTINYTTMPCGSGRFKKFHQWLNDIGANISPKMDLRKLLSIDLNNKYIGLQSILESIKSNQNNFKIDDILNLIDTTNNEYLKYTFITSLKYFKDERIVDKFGKVLLDQVNDSIHMKSLESEKISMLKAILNQNSSAKKNQYLIEFLKSNIWELKLHTAVTLANDGYPDGYNIIFTKIENCYYNKDYCIVRDQLVSLLNLNDSITLPRLISDLKKFLREDYKESTNKTWIIKYYIVLIDIIAGDMDHLTSEDLRQYCLDMDLEMELIKINNKYDLKLNEP